jgi:hypothetical protein
MLTSCPSSKVTRLNHVCLPQVPLHVPSAQLVSATVLQECQTCTSESFECQALLRIPGAQYSRTTCSPLLLALHIRKTDTSRLVPGPSSCHVQHFASSQRCACTHRGLFVHLLPCRLLQRSYRFANLAAALCLHTPSSR